MVFSTMTYGRMQVLTLFRSMLVAELIYHTFRILKKNRR